MAGSPQKRARAAAIADGTHTPGQSARRRSSGARAPTEAETITVEQCLQLAWTLESAWATIGITRDMGREWGDKGRKDPTGPFGDYARRVDVAREAGLQLLHGRVLDGSADWVQRETTYDAEGAVTKSKETTQRGDHRAAQWVLERADPARFSTRVQDRIEQELRAVLEVLERELDTTTYERVLGELSKLGTSEAL